MKILDGIKKGLAIAEVCTTAIELLAKLVKDPGKPEDILKRVSSIVTHAKDAMTGKLDPDMAMSELGKMRADIDAINADIDAKIDEKFPKD